MFTRLANWRLGRSACGIYKGGLAGLYRSLNLKDACEIFRIAVFGGELRPIGFSRVAESYVKSRTTCRLLVTHCVAMATLAFATKSSNFTSLMSTSTRFILPVKGNGD